MKTESVIRLSGRQLATRGFAETLVVTEADHRSECDAAA